MWNVYQYLKDYGNNKVSYQDFINIYKSQEVLRKFIADCYIDVKNHGFITDFKKLTTIEFPNDSYKNIDDFIMRCNDINLTQLVAKNLIEFTDKIYKNN